MMRGVISGVGTDICAIPRIAAALARHGEAFAQRILHPEEEWQVFCARNAQGVSAHDPAPSQPQYSARAVAWLATRFSAKEALSKALGLGLRQPMAWHHCAILNAPNGQPHIHCYGALQAYVLARQLQFHVSVSDERDMVCSFVVASLAPDACHPHTL